MLLELHVWGPAFGLPSIDPHCLAAIAYLQEVVPDGKWLLIASSNPALSPTYELPALRNGDIWIGGFRNIFHYIAQYSAGEWVLDAGLPEQEGADCIAYSSFVESHGQPLLDLSLYVSSQNYNAVTRPIYNTIQPFPLPYLAPPSLRAAAKKRTEHLGLSSLDLDIDEKKESTDHSIIPESLRTQRKTVSSLLAASPETNARIRLNALAMDFFDPLQELLGKRSFMASRRQFSSLDCLALGYMSLMLIPQLPQPWLAKTMREKFPELCTWVEGLNAKIFGGAVGVEEALLVAGVPQGKHVLPWKAPERGGAVAVGGVFLSSLADSLPVIGQLRRTTRMLQHGGKTPDDANSAWRNIATISSILASVGLLAGYLFHEGLISFPETGKKEKKLGDFGEAGQTLFAYANHLDGEVRKQKELEGNSHGEPVVEVDVEVSR